MEIKIGPKVFKTKEITENCINPMWKEEYGGHLELWDPRRWATYEAEATAGPMPDAIAGFVF